MEEMDGHREMSLFSSFCCTKRKPKASHLHTKLLDEESLVHSKPNPKAQKRKPGWTAMPYIIGNETMERSATLGLQANFMIYFMREYNMGQLMAANILNTWNGFSNFTPIVGAFIADAYLGRFRTIAFASFATLAGMVIMTLTAWVPQFHPEPCTAQQEKIDHCVGHTQSQLGVLLAGLFWVAIGTGGIRPCSIPFAIDQFDLTTLEGKNGTSRFYSWYYNTQTLILLVNQTVLVYVQDSVSWTWGFCIPTLLMLYAIILFFWGSKIYVLVEPEGSIFSRMARVIVSSFKKRHCQLSSIGQEDVLKNFYNPLTPEDDEKMPLTEHFGFLNKAALIIASDEVNIDGLPTDPWRLSSVRQVEELKCLLKIIPLWLVSIIAYLPITLITTFPISQAVKMDRHIGPNFEMPASSIVVVTLVTIAIVLPSYDTLLQPWFAKVTKQGDGLTTLQRIGIGNVFSVVLLIVSGLVERQRRVVAISSNAEDGVASMSVMWLAPQFVLLGLTQICIIVGYTEFYNKEAPVNMRSIANALLCLTNSGASYLCNLVVHFVHTFTGKNGQPDWMDNDINEGRLDYFYFLIAGLCLLNFGCFFYCASRHSYRTTIKSEA